MKNCSECGKPIPAQQMFCGVCGAKADQPLKIRRARILFFLTPYLLIIIGLAFCYDLGVSRPADSGLAFGGSFAMIYLAAAAIFWSLARILKLPLLPESYWHAGLFSVVHFIACSFLAYCLDLFLIGEAPKDLGPSQLVTARLEILAVVFLPTWFAGILAVSARAKVVRFPDDIKNRLMRFLAAHALALMPAILAAIAALFFYSQPVGTRAVIIARILHELDAPQQALKNLDEVLLRENNHAAAHYMKGLVIMESQLENYLPADARAHLEKAVALQPNIPVYLFRLSMAYDLERDAPKAIAAASQAVDLLIKDAALWQYLGDLQLKYKHLPAAADSFKKALQINPDNPVLLNNLAYTLLEIDQELPQALEMARLSVEKLPGMHFNLDTLAWAYYKNSQYSQALEIMGAIYHGRTEVTPEVDFHYAMILNAVGTLKDPVKALEDLLAKPEVAADHSLFQQIYAARETVINSLDLAENSQVASGEAHLKVEGDMADEE